MYSIQPGRCHHREICPELHVYGGGGGPFSIGPRIGPRTGPPIGPRIGTSMPLMPCRPIPTHSPSRPTVTTMNQIASPSRSLPAGKAIEACRGCARSPRTPAVLRRRATGIPHSLARSNWASEHGSERANERGSENLWPAHRIHERAHPALTRPPRPLPNSPHPSHRRRDHPGRRVERGRRAWPARTPRATRSARR